MMDGHTWSRYLIDLQATVMKAWYPKQSHGAPTTTNRAVPDQTELDIVRKIQASFHRARQMAKESTPATIATFSAAPAEPPMRLPQPTRLDFPPEWFSSVDTTTYTYNNFPAKKGSETSSTVQAALPPVRPAADPTALDLLGLKQQDQSASSPHPNSMTCEQWVSRQLRQEPGDSDEVDPALPLPVDPLDP